MVDEGDFAPVRPCCMQRHSGPMCPDGRVMCQICFERVLIPELAVEDGGLVNVCRRCSAEENT